MLSANISVESQSADKESLLNVYKRFSQLRNTYPALAEGQMSAHGTFNDSYASQEQIAAWYMSSGSQKVLAVHNFSGQTQTVSLPGDKLTQAIATNGGVRTKDNSLQLDAWSSVVFLQ